MPVELRDEQRRVRVDTRRLQESAMALLKALGRERACLSILLTDDRRMRKLHEKWMGEKGPTDVLSFPMEDPKILGDVAICVTMAARHSPEDVMGEVIRTLIHGVLHLVGYDHVRTTDRERMNRQARRLIRVVE